MNLQWLDYAACHGARHYRSFVRTHRAFHTFLDEVEDRFGITTRRAIVTQIWTSIELETHARGSSPTLAAIDSIDNLPSFGRRILPVAPKKGTPFWMTLLPRTVRVYLRRMGR